MSAIYSKVPGKNLKAFESKGTHGVSVKSQAYSSGSTAPAAGAGNFMVWIGGEFTDNRTPSEFVARVAMSADWAFPDIVSAVFEIGAFPRAFGQWSQLEALLGLQDDWDSYGSEAPNDSAISSARRILHRLTEARLPLPQWIAASPEGGVTLSFAYGDRYAAIEAFNDGEALLVLSEPPAPPQIRPMDVNSESSDADLQDLADFLQTSKT